MGSDSGIRPARLEDLPTLLQFEQGVLSAERPFNERIKHQGARYYDIPSLINDTDSLLLVATIDDVPVASAYLQIRSSRPAFIHDRHGYIGFVYVEPAQRGHGLSGQLLEALMESELAKGVEDFYLDVYACNTTALKAYEKAGFHASLLEMRLTR